jgi:phosphatidylglycerophosphatase A
VSSPHQQPPASVTPPSPSGPWLIFVGSFFGAGLAPRLRGTVGTFVPAVLIGLINDANPDLPWWWTLVAGVAVFFVSLPLASAASKGLSKDPSWFVLDEVCGMLLTVSGLTAITRLEVWPATIIAFLFFRAFDGLKPPPIKRFERIGGGLGVMADDVVAAVMAWPLALGCCWVAVKAGI